MAHFSELRCLFDQLLSYFLKRVSVNKDAIWGFPPKLCDGVEPDLFTLFWVVRKIGDFELVSKNELWEFVAEKCGLDITHVGSLKLIYINYLEELDQWFSLKGFKDMKLGNGELGVLEKLDSFFHELSRCKYSFETDKKGKCVVIGSKDDGSIKSSLCFHKKMDLDMTKSKVWFPRINNINEKNEEYGNLDLNMAKTEIGLSKINNVKEKDEKFSGLDLNTAITVKDDNFSGLDLNMALTEWGSSRINNVVAKDKIFNGFDLNMAITEMGSPRINNVDEKDEEFDGFDLNMAITEMGSSRINNVDEKDEIFYGFDLNVDITEMGSSKIINIDKKYEEFGNLDNKITKLPREIVVKKVDGSMIKDDDDKKVVLCPMNVLSFRSENNVVGSQTKKKEESLSLLKMLDWVTNVARNPNDVAIRSIPNSSKWKKYKGNEVWKQVLLVKETLFAKRNIDPNNKVHGSQKKRHMMHPSMYEDDKMPIHLSSKRMRCSLRVSSVKSCSCPGCISCSSSRNKRLKKIPQILETVDPQDDTCQDLETENVNVRAEVPEWTGVISESDPKWLGTQMWPPPEDNNNNRNKKHENEILIIGKGRQSSCKCLTPGSTDCVRFHIAENRTKVKRTLGPLFYKWKFNHMGEEASGSLLSLEEETAFKSLVIKARQELTDKSKSRQEIMNIFWKRASESIPLKTKDILVSYYYNVFVLRRRSYQNRVMPENIDSDDDEQELGFEKSAPRMNLDS